MTTQVDTQLIRESGSGAIAPAIPLTTDTNNHTKKVSYTGTAAWNTGDLLSGEGIGLFVYATTLCHVVFSSAATVTAATNTDQPIPAGLVIQLPYAGVQSISAIRNASSGDIYVTEIVQATVA